MRIDFKPQINNKPAFNGIYATMGSFEDNSKIFAKLTEASENYNERFNSSQHRNFKQSGYIDGLYMYEALQLAPNDVPNSIQIIGTNENAKDLMKFHLANKTKYDIDLYTGERQNHIDLKAQEYYNRGEIDNFLDCLLEKRNRVETSDVFDEANRIVKAIRKRAKIHFGFVPILKAKAVLEQIEKGNFDFVKGIVIKK